MSALRWMGGIGKHPCQGTAGFLPGIVLTCALTAGEVDCPIVFTDISRDTGIEFVHTDGSSGRRYIVESVSCGLALLDFDKDGDVDIYFLNGSALPGTEAKETARNSLYRNEGGLRFTDVTRQTGVGDPGYGLGVCTGDFNNDGHLDIFVNNFGPNVLYRNNGDGTFTDVAPEAGVAGGNQVGAGACFLDMDGDGDLDLFVGHYVGFTYESHKISHMSGFPSYVGPLNYPPTSNLLYRNNGDGTFTDVSETSGIAAYKGSGMGTVCADFDNDGDTDIVVGNDLAANFLFRNDGKGHFDEIGLGAGLAYDVMGRVHGTMAVECGDWNNDGWLDFYTTSYQRQLTTLYQNQGGRFFEDVTRQTGSGEETYAQVTWGAGMIDLDNDSDKDLFIACGHLIDNVEMFDDTTAYNALNMVLVNTGVGRFTPLNQHCGNGLLPKYSSRGAAFDDLDNDGDIDVVVVNSRREPTILRNDTVNDHHWIQIELRGTATNRDGIGARVTVEAGKLKRFAEVHSGRSYQSDYGRRLHFGLGRQDRINRIQVKWIGGGMDTVENPSVDRVISIVEGRGLKPASGP